jgi:predicted transcriptional regulator
VPRRSKEANPALGDLESEVMRVLWSLGRATVPDVRKAIRWERPLAYTTVMTVLGRLVEKGFLEREKEGRFYVYAPRVGREAVAGSALRGVVERFYDGMGRRAVAQLLSEDEGLDEEDLAALERLIRERRKERR